MWKITCLTWENKFPPLLAIGGCDTHAGSCHIGPVRFKARRLSCVFRGLPTSFTKLIDSVEDYISLIYNLSYLRYYLEDRYNTSIITQCKVVVFQLFTLLFPYTFGRLRYRFHPRLWWARGSISWWLGYSCPFPSSFSNIRRASLKATEKFLASSVPFGDRSTKNGQPVM